MVVGGCAMYCACAYSLHLFVLQFVRGGERRSTVANSRASSPSSNISGRDMGSLLGSATRPRFSEGAERRKTKIYNIYATRTYVDCLLWLKALRFGGGRKHTAPRLWGV